MEHRNENEKGGESLTSFQNDGLGVVSELVKV